MLTQEIYQKLLLAYAASPAMHSQVARLVGCPIKTARRAWDPGYHWDWAPCIRLEVEKLQAAVRAARYDSTKAAEEAQEVAQATQDSILALARAQAARTLQDAKQTALNLGAESQALAALKIKEAESTAAQRIADAERQARQKMADLLDKAKVDAVETLSEEAQMVKMARRAALGCVAVSAIVFKEAQAFATLISKAMQDPTLNSRQVLQGGYMLSRMAEATERVVYTALQAERLKVGDPTEIIGLRTEVPMEEVEIKMRAVQGAMDRAKARLANSSASKAIVNGTATNTAAQAAASESGTATNGTGGPLH